MFYRLFLLFMLVPICSYAEPSIAQIQQAVSQNPALLETPQAKAMMLEKGVTLSEVKQKLAETPVAIEGEQSSSDTPLNTIDTTSSEEHESTDFKESTIAKRVSPFAFKTDAQLKTDMDNKQQSVSSSSLRRYSSSFYANKNTLDISSLPTPDDYVISTSDSIGIHIYGDRDNNYKVSVKNDGTIDLAYIGPITIGGMKFIDAKKHLIHQLKSHYKNSDIDINIDKYSTIQVTLIGDVKYPGVYNLSSFSRVKDLLIVAQGIRETGSVRDIIVKRNSKVIAQIDFYDLLFKGNTAGSILLEKGDVVIIQKAQKLVSIDGYVNNAAIFELTGKENLNKLIEYAGGMKPDASKTEIKIERYSDNTKLETFKVKYKDSNKFKMKNGDKVYIYPLDFTAKSSINIYGNVIRPGTYALNDKKTLNEFFKLSLQDGVKKFFLPNTFFDYAVIKKYSDTLTYSSKSFNLLKVINGEEVVDLTPNDQIFIFSLNDIYSNSYVMTKGSTLIKPGKLQYIAGITIKDAINASGIDGVIDDKVRITTYATDDFMPKTTFYSLEKDGNTLLNPYDEVEVYDYYASHILEPVSISGEVVNPTTVYYENGMNLNDLIVVASGLTKRAYKKKIEIVRYSIDENQTRQREILEFSLENRKFTEIKLEPYDEVKIFTIPNWSEHRSVTLKGEVKFPGIYTIENGERLSSVIKRAGGFTKDAFTEGAVFTRESIKKSQLDQYNKSLAKIKRELAIYNAMPANSKKSIAPVSPDSALNEVIAEAKKYEPVGRISIKIDEDMSILEKSSYDLVLEDNDTLSIPGHIDTVSIFGEVFNPTSFIYNSNINSEDYIELASGYTRAADKNRAYVIHADGTSEPAVSGWWIFSSTLDITNGDTIVVPIYIQEYNQLELWDSLARILASFAVTAATLNTLGVIQ